MSWKASATMTTVLAVLTAAGGSAAQTSQSTLVTEALSPATRALLIEEMQALADAMGRIHRAMVTGEHQSVATEARAVHDSFVLARELSEAQRREIRAELPAAFIAADQEFHELAARLADAAARQDIRLERLWFDEMTRDCLACHRRFAGRRFAGLVPDGNPGRSPDSP